MCMCGFFFVTWIFDSVYGCIGARGDVCGIAHLEQKKWHVVSVGYLVMEYVYWYIKFSILELFQTIAGK